MTPYALVFLSLFSSMVPGMHASSAAAPTKVESLLVVNQGDATVSVVDPVSKRAVATIHEDVPTMVAHEVVASPDGKLAYLPLYGNAGVGKPGTDGQLILVIDLTTNKVIDKIDLGHGVRPHCILYDPNSKLLYVTTELDKAVTIVDPKTRKVVGKISTDQEQSHMLTLSHDGRFGYTANVGPGTVSVLDLKARKFVTTIPIAQTTQRIAISNDDKWVFTSDQTKPQMAVIDTATNTIKQWLQLPSLGYGSTFTHDGHWMLTTLPVAGQLAIVDLKTMSVTKTIDIGPKPQEVLLSPDGKFAYVSCFGGHQVAVVDTASWSVSSMIDVGEKADGMTWVRR